MLTAEPGKRSLRKLWQPRKHNNKEDTINMELTELGLEGEK